MSGIDIATVPTSRLPHTYISDKLNHVFRMTRVKGLAFRSVLKALEKLRGVGALEAVFAQLGSERERSLRYVVASSWYPVEAYAALWQAIQMVTGNHPDFPRQIGRLCVEQDLRLVHKLAFAALSVPTVMDISARLFNSYYDTGSCKSTMTGAREVKVELQGCLGFTGPMWTELRGASECFAEQASRRPAVSEVTSGGHTNDTSMTMIVRWDA